MPYTANFMICQPDQYLPKGDALYYKLMISQPDQYLPKGDALYYKLYDKWLEISRRVTEGFHHLEHRSRLV